MINKVSKLKWLMALAIFATAAASQAHPYEEIEARNAFRLKAAPEAPEVVPVPTPETPVNLVLSGMGSLDGKKQVFLSLSTPGEKETKYFKLGENERQGPIEVLEIDLKNDRVRIKHNGQPAVLTFVTHGAKPTAPVPVVTPAPAMPANPAPSTLPVNKTRVP